MNQPIKKISANTLRKQSGLSLVELMIALTLGLIVLGGFTTIMIGSRESYRTNEALSRMQENARYAFQVMSQDIRMAGYFGCTNVSDSLLDNTLNYDVNADSEFYWRFEQSIEGYEAAGAVWDPVLIGTKTIPHPLSGSDIIVIRGMSDIDGGVTARVFEEPSTAALKITTAANSLKDGDVVAASNCRGDVSIFQINSIDSAGSVEILNHTTVTAEPGNLSNSLRDKYFHENDVITINKVSTKSYFIRNKPPEPSLVPSEPALFRKSGSSPAQEMVEGVENMQIQYGVDTSDDGAVNEYRPADVLMNDWAKDIVSIRINLLMQTLAKGLASQPQSYRFNGEDVTPTDRRLRQVYSTVIALRNRTLK